MGASTQCRRKAEARSEDRVIITDREPAHGLDRRTSKACCAAQRINETVRSDKLCKYEQKGITIVNAGEGARRKRQGGRVNRRLKEKTCNSWTSVNEGDEHRKRERRIERASSLSQPGLRVAG